jgi:hypothetical protein
MGTRLTTSNSEYENMRQNNSVQIREIYRVWWGNLRERAHLEDPGIDGRIILRLIFRKWDGRAWTGWSWLRIGTGGGHL